MLTNCNKRLPTLSDIRELRSILMGTERRTYLSPPRTQQLAPGGRSLIPIPPLCLSSTGYWAFVPLLGRNTRWDGSGYILLNLPHQLCPLTSHFELASVAS